MRYRFNEEWELWRLLGINPYSVRNHHQGGWVSSGDELDERLEKRRVQSPKDIYWQLTGRDRFFFVLDMLNEVQGDKNGEDSPPPMIRKIKLGEGDLKLMESCYEEAKRIVRPKDDYRKLIKMIKTLYRQKKSYSQNSS